MEEKYVEAAEQAYSTSAFSPVLSLQQLEVQGICHLC